MGNAAFAHAALEAGVNVVAGYPGTPSSELIETVAAQVRAGVAAGVHVEWSTNEKAALELLCGASYAGARVLFTCKQMGLNVAADALLSVNYVGVGGGMVLFVADDPGPISSQTEQDTRRFAAFAKVPVLDPATPEQGFSMMSAAFDLSEKYHTPVILRPTTRVCHASAYFDVAEKTQARALPEAGFVRDPKWVIFPKRSYEAHAEIEERLAKISGDFSHDAAFAQFNVVREFGSSSKAPRLGIIAGGVSAGYALDALEEINARARERGVALPAHKFMQIGCPYPFPAAAVEKFMCGLDYVLVFEELDYVIEDELLRLSGRLHTGFEVLGKHTHHTLERGENSIDDCYARILAFFEAYGSLETEALGQNAAPYVYESAASAEGATVAGELDTAAPPAACLPVRPPVLCAGCPHRGSFYAIKRALGKQEAVYCGDIGCYTLGNAAPLHTTDTCLCMGAGITMAQGFNVAEPHKKQVAFVGDSTFFASAMTGVANAVYNNHNITIAVLDNSTTAMTGGQPHPGTGVPLMPSVTDVSVCGTVRGLRGAVPSDHSTPSQAAANTHLESTGNNGAENLGTHPISITAVLEALGVKCIKHANPLDHAQAKAAAKEALDFAGPSAIIFRSPCVQLVRAGEPAHINEEICTGCKRCITQIGCPGIYFEAGAAHINTTQCNGCGLCAQVCLCGAIGAAEGAAAGAAEGAAAAGTQSSKGDAATTTSANTTQNKEVSHD